MRENIKISLCVGIAFLVAFGILLLFFIMYNEGLLTNTPITKGEIGVKNTIFLLGTSYVGAINSTHVQNTLSDFGFNISVLNPINNKITPTLGKLDNFISNKPKLVVYGVGFRDIGFKEINGRCNLSPIPSYIVPKNSTLPDTIIENNGQKSIEFNIFSQNPKRITFDIFENILGEKQIEYVSKQNSKKINVELNHFEFDEIRPITDLNKSVPNTYCMDFDTRNLELDSLDSIFTEFHKNDIDVIVFIPPYTASYLNELSPALKSELIFNVKSISEKHEFNFYDLSFKFKNKNIFSDHTHVAYNQKSLIYSETIASLILPSLYADYTSYGYDNDLLLRKDLSKINFSYVDLSKKDMSNKDMSYSNFHGANLTNADLSSTIMINSILSHVDLSNTILTNTILTGADLSNTILTNVDLSNKDLTNTILTNVDLSNKDLTNTILTGADLTNTILTNVDLSNKDLTNTILTGADLSNTILTNVDLSNKDLTNTILTGSALTNVKLNKAHGSNSDFSSTVMINVDMTQSSFLSTNFSNSTILNLRSFGALFSNSDFSYSQILDSNLQGSYLDNSDLSHVKFNNSNLFGVNLSNSKMNFTMMESTNIKNANFESIILENSKFVDVNMNCIHHVICE